MKANVQTVREPLNPSAIPHTLPNRIVILLPIRFLFPASWKDEYHQCDGD